MESTLQSIGSHGLRGCSSGVLINHFAGKILINAGESFQRLSTEWRLRASKIEDIVITSLSPKNLSGLPGLLLTLESLETPTFDLKSARRSDCDLSVAFGSTFVGTRWHTHTDAAEGQARISSRISYRPILKKSSNFDQTGQNQLLVNDDYESFCRLRHSVRCLRVIGPFGLLQYIQRFMRLCARLSKLSVEVIELGAPGAAPGAEGASLEGVYKYSPLPALSGIDLSFLCFLDPELDSHTDGSPAPKRLRVDPELEVVTKTAARKVSMIAGRGDRQVGRFLLEQALKLGVPRGPLFAKLKSGASVTLKDGRTILAEQVCEPTHEGVPFFIIPDLDLFLNKGETPDPLEIPGPVETPVSSHTDEATRTGFASDTKTASKIWRERFSKVAKDLSVSRANSPSRSSLPRLGERESHVFVTDFVSREREPQLVQCLGQMFADENNEQPEVVLCRSAADLSRRSSKTVSESQGNTKLSVKPKGEVRVYLLTAAPEDFDTPVPFPTCDSLCRRLKQQAPALFQYACLRTVKLPEGFALASFPLVPYLKRKPELCSPPKNIFDAKPNTIQTGLAAADSATSSSSTPSSPASSTPSSNPGSIAEGKEAGDVSVPAAGQFVRTLGTGAAIPSKLRNVSSTLVSFNEKFAALLDVGEATTIQLALSSESFDAFAATLRRIRFIFLSHKHADHIMGLPRFLEVRASLRHRDRSTKSSQPPLYICCSVDMDEWVRCQFQAVGDDNFHIYHCEDFDYTRCLPESSAMPINHAISVPDTAQTDVKDRGPKSGINANLVSVGGGDQIAITTCLVKHLTNRRGDPAGSFAVRLAVPAAFSVCFSGDLSIDSNYERFLTTMTRIRNYNHIGTHTDLPTDTNTHADAQMDTQADIPANEAGSIGFGGLGSERSGVDVLIHEATFEEKLRSEATKRHHCTVEDVGRAAQLLLGPPLVILTHFSQRYPSPPKLKTLDDSIAVVSALDLLTIPVELTADNCTLENITSESKIAPKLETRCRIKPWIRKEINAYHAALGSLEAVIKTEIDTSDAEQESQRA